MRPSLLLLAALTLAPPAFADDAPSAWSAVPIPDGQIDAAVAAVDGLVADVMAKTGVPGMAVAVVRRASPRMRDSVDRDTFIRRAASCWSSPSTSTRRKASCPSSVSTISLSDINGMPCGLK